MKRRGMSLCSARVCFEWKPFLGMKCPGNQRDLPWKSCPTGGLVWCCPPPPPRHEQDSDPRALETGNVSLILGASHHPGPGPGSSLWRGPGPHVAHQLARGPGGLAGPPGDPDSSGISLLQFQGQNRRFAPDEKADDRFLTTG